MGNATARKPNAAYGPGPNRMPIWMDDVMCLGKKELTCKIFGGGYLEAILARLFANDQLRRLIALPLTV